MKVFPPTYQPHRSRDDRRRDERKRRDFDRHGKGVGDSHRERERHERRRGSPRGRSYSRSRSRSGSRGKSRDREHRGARGEKVPTPTTNNNSTGDQMQELRNSCQLNCTLVMQKCCRKHPGCEVLTSKWVCGCSSLYCLLSDLLVSVARSCYRHKGTMWTLRSHQWGFNNSGWNWPCYPQGSSTPLCCFSRV